MKRMMVFFVALAILLMGITIANAGQNLVETVANGCKMEIEKYCGQVTPGEGRVLACFTPMRISCHQNVSTHYMTPLFGLNGRLPLSVTGPTNAMRIWKNIADPLQLVKDVFSTASKNTTKRSADVASRR